MNDSHPDNRDFNDPEICDNLRRIVPEDLSTAGLVEGARHKRRRRQGMIGAAAALVMVAVAVPVAVNLQHDAITAQPAATPSAVSALPGAQACYNDDGTPISWAQDDATGPAEPGAVKAWLCGDYSPETGQGFVGPLEPLTSGLDAIIEDVQAADEIDLTVTTCMNDYNLSFNAVFEYPNGTRRIIGGDRHGCRTTYDGGTVRAGADEFYGALYAAWVAQRETDTGDWVVPANCPAPLPLIGMEPGEAVQGAICGDGAPGSGWRAARLSDDLLAEVTDSMEAALAGAGEDAPNPGSDSPEQPVWLTLANRFTDQQSFVRREDGSYRARDGEGRHWTWVPSPELSATLDEALSTADPADPPPVAQPVESGDTAPSVSADPGLTDEFPQPWVAEGCSDIASGDLVPTQLPDGVLPDDAERVWLCASGASQIGAPTPPMEPLVEPALVDGATQSFNELLKAPADQACTLELGPSYLVVHEYADGTRHAVELQEYGCRSVHAGDVVKGNSELYREQLLALWEQQRAGAPVSQVRPAPLCHLATSMLIPDPAAVEFTSGAACVGPPEDEVSQVAQEVSLPGDLVTRIVEEMATAELGTLDAIPRRGNVVLLTEAGDPFLLQRQDDGSFWWQNGEYTLVWSPSPELAEELVTIFGE